MEDVGMYGWEAATQQRLTQLTGITEAYMWWLHVTHKLGSCVRVLNGDMPALIPEGAETHNKMAQILEKVSDIHGYSYRWQNCTAWSQLDADTIPSVVA